MWRRIQNREAGRPLPQSNNVAPTSAQAYETVRIAEARENVMRHLADERDGSFDEGNFRPGIGYVSTFRLPQNPLVHATDVSWVYLPTLFVVTVTEKDEDVEVAFIPDDQNDVDIFYPLMYDNRPMEVWIDLRGYWGDESFITDSFVRPYRFIVNMTQNGWRATIGFSKRTRHKAGVLVGRVLVKMGHPKHNLLNDDFTMKDRLTRSESAYPSQAALVPRLEKSTSANPSTEACVIWVHGTLSCALEGIKDLPFLPKLPMYRFEHDTFHEIGANAEELASLVDQLGYQRTHLLAHSRGGLVARFCQQILSNRPNKTCQVTTFGTPHLGTPIANAASGGLALLMRAGDFIVDGIPYASLPRRIGSLMVGLELPAGIRAMQPSSEILKAAGMLLRQPFESWAGHYTDTGGTASYGQDVGAIVEGAFGANVENDLVVATQSSLGGNLATKLETSHFDYFKKPEVQSFIGNLS